MKNLLRSILSLLIPVFLFSGCTDEDQSTRLMVTLVDSPGDYEAVNVDIQGVSVHVNADAHENEAGWVMLEGSDVGVVNLLELTDGTELTLYDSDFPTGMISQMRILLGDNNTLVIDASTDEMEDYDTVALNTPSAQQSGLKLLVNTYLEDGITYNFKLDFEAAKSVIATGSGKYNLKPVIKVITTALSGAIEGEVLPAEEVVAIYALDGSDTVGTAYTELDESDFMIPGIGEGTYTLSFDPGDSSDYQGTSLNDVNVVTGDVTDVGTVELELK